MCYGAKIVDTLTRRNVGGLPPPILAVKAKRFVLSTQVETASSEGTAATTHRSQPISMWKGQEKPGEGERWKETSLRLGGRCGRSLHTAPQRSQSGTE